jgi:tetratricopeptide (TPR) repeat protein
MTNAIWPSAFVAALFALHPLHVESVAWVSERKDVLSAFFWLLTMWAYIRFVNPPSINLRRTSRPKISNYLLVVIFFALGLMSKPMLVTLPFVLLLLDYWPLERFSKKHSLSYLFIEKIPLFMMILASSIITFIVQKESGVMRPVTEDYSIPIRLANASISYMQYIIKMIWPLRLAVFYPHPGRNISIPYAIISAVVLLTVTILVLRFAGRRRYLVTGWFWYLGTLVPVIGLVQVGQQAFADRYSYITLTGLFIIVAWGLPELAAKWRYKKAALASSAVLVIGAMSIHTYFQLDYWRNSLTLFQHAIDVTEDNYMAHFFIAEPLRRQGRVDEAIYHCSQAVRICPNYVGAINSLGNALCQAGRIDEAVVYYKKALELDPNFALIHDNLGSVLTIQGRYDEAVGHLTESLRLNPDSATSHYYLGLILAKRDKIEEAVTHFEKSLQIYPDWFEPMNQLAWYLAASKQTAVHNPGRAVKLAQRACELTNYKKPDLLDTLAVSYAAAGDFDKAVETARKALELCQSSKQQTLKEKIEKRLILYKAGKPYIE